MFNEAHQSIGEHLTNEAIKVAPPAGTSVALLAGVSLNDIVLTLTAIYTVIQIAVTIFKVVKEHRK